MASAFSTLMRRSLFLGDTEDAAAQLGEIRALVTAAARELPDSRLTVRMLRETLTLAECFFHTALLTALTEAQGDGVVLPFAENPELLPLLKKLNRGSVNEGFLSRVRQQCEFYRTVVPAAPQETSVCLTERELAVLRLIAQGKSRAEAAAVFRVQENTVKAQFSSAYRKLGAHGKTEAVRLAKTYGLL